MKIARLLRGIAGTALTWALAWAPLTVALTAIFALVGGVPPPRDIWGVLLLRQAIVGAINGAVFASTLALFGRRQTLSTLRSGRVALYGAIGGSGFPVLTTLVVVRMAHVALPATALVALIVTNAVLGASLAVGSLSLAQRAPELSRADSSRLAEIGSGAS